MTDGGGGESSETVGSVAEEAAKLLSALQDWAKEAGHENVWAASEAAGGIAASLRGLGEQVGHGPDCRYCPVCQAINLVRETSPEAKQHLAAAAGSLLQAVQSLMATPPPEDRGPRRGGPVEKIDLDDAPWDDQP